MFATAHGEGHVLLNGHRGCCTGHGILENTAKECGASVFRKVGHIIAVDHNGAAVDGKHTGHCVEQGGFACTVAADNGDKITFLQMQISTGEGDLFRDGAGIKRFDNLIDIQHFTHPAF